jgi:chromate transport protein ChrA
VATVSFITSRCDTFLAGYGVAQAIPGPLFTFASYLGAVVSPSPNGLAGAATGLIAIFLPCVLILMGTLPFWETFRKRAGAQAITRGVNAAIAVLHRFAGVSLQSRRRSSSMPPTSTQERAGEVTANTNKAGCQT